MVIGILQVELSIDWSASLKDKRRVIASLKARLHQEHQVSVAEVDRQDDLRTAVLGVAMAASDVKIAQGVLGRVLKKVEQHRDCVVTDHAMEILSGR